ncbi:MAG: hypothetical protein NTY33_00795 [Candidatus Moranbacteria bacterium]|nr:hypothetical protein [Candidatus Moranbacteria bacterium]
MKVVAFILFLFLYLHFVENYTFLESAIDTVYGTGGFLAIFLIGWVMWRLITGSWNPKKWSNMSEQKLEETKADSMIVVMKYFIGGLGGAIILIFLLAVIIGFVLKILKIT